MYKGLSEQEGAKEMSGYSPLVNWGTIQILFSLTLQYNFCTTQWISKGLYPSPTQMSHLHEFSTRPTWQEGVLFKVLRMNLSLCSHCYAAKLFYELI